MRYAWIFIFLFYFAFRTFAQTGQAAFLPVKDNIPGWRPTGDPEIYRESGLYDLEKEDYKLILEYGFDYAVSARYYNFRGEDIDVKVFTMNTTFGSCGLFMRSSRGNETFREYGNAVYKRENEYGFWKHIYFIKMTSRFSGDTINEGFRQIAGFIDARIRTKGKPPEILDYCVDKKGTVTIFKGPLALSEIYYFSPLNIFFADEGIAVTNGDTTELIFAYIDDNEAVRRFTEVAGIVSQMSKFSDFIMPAPFTFAMMDRNGKMLTFRVIENKIDVIIK